MSQEFPGCEVILFGSHTRGQAHKYSDIDVAIILPSIDGDFLTMAARLCHLRNDIDAMIEPHLLSRNANASGFLDEVLRTGEVIHAAESAHH